MAAFEMLVETIANTDKLTLELGFSWTISLPELTSSKMGKVGALKRGTGPMFILRYSRLLKLMLSRVKSYSWLLGILAALPAAATVTITSPADNSTSINAVTITANATNEGSSFTHLEVWDNGTKLGDVFSTSVDAVYVLPDGAHTTTVNAVTAQGQVLDGSNVSYTVSQPCSNSSTVQCSFDDLGSANPQSNCSPPQEPLWVGNPCGAQGPGSSLPASISIQTVTDTPHDNGQTLDGSSLYLSETQNSAGYSNVLFKADSPTPTSSLHSNWVLDEYVNIPNPNAHIAFEVDVQYVWGGIWTKFYTECAFDQGVWGVLGPNGSWVFLTGNGVPSLPCSRSQFSPGWHHLVWTFQRASAGYAVYVSLTFDGQTTSLHNFVPTTQTLQGQNAGNFSALVQLDGVQNASMYPVVDVYVDKLNITHTP